MTDTFRRLHSLSFDNAVNPWLEILGDFENAEQPACLFSIGLSGNPSDFYNVNAS